MMCRVVHRETTDNKEYVVLIDETQGACRMIQVLSLTIRRHI